MIFSEKHRFIFFANPKAGSTSVEHVLARFDEGHKYRFRAPGFFREKHIPPALVKALMPRELWDGSFKFIFVRNPYSWFVSQWFHNFDKRRNDETTLIRRTVRSLSNTKRMLVKRVNGETLASLAGRKQFSPEDVRFLYEYLKSRNRHLPIHDGAFQVGYCQGADGERLLDYVGRYENLTRDFDHAMSRIGLQVKLPHLNATRHRRYTEYFTPEAADVVYELWNIDFETFGYEKRL